MGHAAPPDWASVVLSAFEPTRRWTEGGWATDEGLEEGPRGLLLSDEGGDGRFAPSVGEVVGGFCGSVVSSAGIASEGWAMGGGLPASAVPSLSLSSLSSSGGREVREGLGKAVGLVEEILKPVILWNFRRWSLIFEEQPGT